MEDNFKNIDKFIKKNLEVDSSSLNFTDSVLQRIKIDEAIQEKALTSLLQKHGEESPSEDFITKVMFQVKEHEELIKYQPVISKKGWTMIAVISLSTVGYILVNSDGSKAESDILYRYLSAVENLFSFNVPAILTSPIFALSLFALSTLLTIDYYIRNKSFL